MIFVFLTIALTVYGQLVIKWQVLSAGAIPPLLPDKLLHFYRLILHPWVLSAFAATFGAGLSWMVAMSRVQLSYAYPYVGFSFILILFFSALLFYEPLSWQKVLGAVFIILGIYVSSQG